MRRWFRAQPIHRKLVLTSMVKTTVVLVAAMVTLLCVDVLRFQRNVTTAASALAAMVAENIRVALALGDTAGVSQTLETVRLQASAQKACAYGTDGALVSEFVREMSAPCPAVAPTEVRWSVLGASAPAEVNGSAIGLVYVEMNWAAMRARFLTAGATSLVVLVIAAGVMFVLSHRLHRRISDPITQLAAAARRMGKAEDDQSPLPRVEAPQDEVDELVNAFGAMVDRVRTANLDLTQANGAMRHEIDERRAVEVEREALLGREREAHRIKDEFLATVSHELRTPLNAIVGWARILSTAGSNPETVAKAAASVHRNALTQARVIDDLIDISRIVTGRLKVLKEPVDLCAVIDSAVLAVRPTAQQTGIDLTFQLPSSPCLISGDRDRLHQVVWNLLSNAVKFAPGGAVRVRLEPQDSTCTLVVEDTGVGIAPEFLDQVFDRFRQADASPTREHGGLGIGLAIAKELVELHGGFVRAESAGRGQGARFSVVLPRFVGQEHAHTSEERPPSLAGISVLAVDDNLDSIEILEAALTKAGATVRVASSGAEALDLWRQELSDVLLCELAMPKMSGFELLAQVRELDRAAGRVTPAIAVTAHAGEEEVARSAQAGFQMHVAKPFDANRLIRAVGTARTRV